MSFIVGSSYNFLQCKITNCSQKVRFCNLTSTLTHPLYSNVFKCVLEDPFCAFSVCNGLLESKIYFGKCSFAFRIHAWLNKKNFYMNMSAVCSYCSWYLELSPTVRMMMWIQFNDKFGEDIADIPVYCSDPPKLFLLSQ